jgi:glycosyltransferase involved in cell wall biosynthesis
VKIALHVDGPIIRGNEQQLLVLVEGLVKRGHEVVASCRGGGPVEAALRKRGARTTHIRPRGDADVVSAFRFARWLRRERVDAVLLTSWVRAFIASWAAHMARVPRIVFRIGGVQPVHKKGRARLERHALRHWVHAVIANSSHVAAHMTAALPELADRLSVVHNGIAGVDAVDAVTLRAQLGIAADAVLAVSVGGMEDNKGFDILIEAAALTESVHVVLVGGGTEAQQTKRASLARICGVEERVHFVGRRTDIPAILAACDVFVMASRSEGFSVALLEAMRAGLPIIATDVGGAQDALAPSAGRPAAGWIIPPADVSIMAERLNDVASGIRSTDARITDAASEAAWRARNWFTQDRMIDGYEAVLAGRHIPHARMQCDD